MGERLDGRARGRGGRDRAVPAPVRPLRQDGFSVKRSIRAARDRSIEKIFNQTRDAWQTAMKALLRRGVREGNLRADLDSEAVATVVIAVLTALTIPPLRDSPRGDQALRQLERWLGIAGR